MKFAIHNINPFKINSEDKDSISEVIIPYYNQINALQEVLAINENGYNTILDIPIAAFDRTLEVLIKETSEIYRASKKVGFRIPFPSQEFMEKVPNAFLHYNYAAGTVQEAMSQYASGAKEVYVSGSLAADTRALTELIGKVKIRLIPNVVQTNAFTFGNPGNIDPFQCFWLRPEGVKHYEYIVDIMEFAFVEGQEDREAAMLHFYNMGEYKNKLGLLITDNTGKLNTIDSLFHQEIDESKSKCGLKCQSGGSCSICSRIPQQATILRQAMKIYKEDDFS